MELTSILSKTEVIKALEHKRDSLIEQWEMIDHSLIHDHNMPALIRELRSIQADAMEYEIRLLDKRINEVKQK